MVTKENVKEWLLNHRLVNNLTQIKVSEKTGISVQTLSGIESGSIKPQSMTVFKLNEYSKRFPDA